jgi:hypothetical protein
MNSTFSNKPADRTDADAALDRLLQEAATRQWPGRSHHPRIEEFLMNEIAKKGRSRRWGMLLGLGALLTTGAVFGAARLYDQYTVRVEWNGQVYEGVADVALDGSASMDIALEGCGSGTVYIEPGGEEGQVTVSVECDTSGQTCDFGVLPAPEGEVTIDCSACPEDGCEKPCESTPGTP